jgi:predicted O-methyltransferase YrrM
MNNLNHYLIINGATDMEGHSQNILEQTKRLQELVSASTIKKVFEIGFNAGHSADTFLKSNTNINLVSCDLNERPCVKYGKEYIDKTYPNRHSLILGDSIVKVPEYIKQYPENKYDLIFIDGGHSYEIAKADLINCKELAHKDTIVLVDDVSNYITQQCSWAIEPTNVWNEFIKNNFIKEIAHDDYAIGRGMSWGKYIF